jgi:hypothetical protein
MTADSDGDGKPDDAFLRIVCTGSGAAEASLWSWGATNSGGHARAAPPVGTGEWTSPSPKLQALSGGYLHKKLAKPAAGARASAAAAGWVPVTLSGAQGLCPAAAKTP